MNRRRVTEVFAAEVARSHGLKSESMHKEQFPLPKGGGPIEASKAVSFCPQQWGFPLPKGGGPIEAAIS